MNLKKMNSKTEQRQRTTKKWT